MSVARTKPISLPQACRCPRCEAALILWRSRMSAIDACGFESYSFACDGCGAGLAGIVDPADDALLLSVVQD